MVTGWYFLCSPALLHLKDYKSDSKEGLKTLPVVFGKANAIKFLHFLNYAAFVPLIIAVYLKIIPQFSLFLILFFFYSLYYLKKAQNSFNNDVWVNLGLIADFEFIFWPVALIFLQQFSMSFNYTFW